jgi:hypothetical protein
MSYSMWGGAAAIGFIAIVGISTAVDRSANYTEAKATIFRIDRECKFTRHYEGGKAELGVTQSCNATDEFARIAAAPKRPKIVDGKAVVKVSYTAPQDGSYRTSALHFDGRDEEFYKLKAGDEVAVLVRNDDPSKITAD